MAALCPSRGESYQRMDMMQVTLSPGAATVHEEPHAGDECGLVITGKIWITLGKDVYTASSGDAFYYTASSEHWIENRTGRKSTFLWISAPPSFF